MMFYNLLRYLRWMPRKEKTMPNPDIKKLPLAANQYYPAKHTKKYIFLHHTAGGSAASSVAHWAANPDHIATPYIIDRDGTIYECYNPEMWAYHLGVKGNSAIEKASIGIEICSYGCLAIANQDDDKGKFKSGDAVTYAGRKMDVDKVVTIPPFRAEVNPFIKNQLVNERVTYTGTLWEAYTPEQIEALRLLLPYLMGKFAIPLQAEASKFYEYQNPSTLPPGIYSHTTVRKDKIDIFPQPELVELVANL